VRAETIRYLLESRCAISFDLIAGNGAISPLCYHTYNVRPLISADYLCIHSITITHLRNISTLYSFNSWHTCFTMKLSSLTLHNMTVHCDIFCEIQDKCWCYRIIILSVWVGQVSTEFPASTVWFPFVSNHSTPHISVDCKICEDRCCTFFVFWGGE
jgi:hypothetical protein